MIMQQQSYSPTTKPSRMKFVVLSLFTLFFLIYAYTFLHEAGHALVGLGFGQTLTNFDINFWNLNPHVSMSGELTSVQRAIFSVAGASLPFLVWIGFILLVPRKTNFVLDFLRFASSISIFFSLTVWVILPVLYYFEKAPSRDDVISFLNVSQMSPWLLSLSGLIACLICIVLIWTRIGNVREKLLFFRKTEQIQITPGFRITIVVMVSILIFCFGISIITNNLIAEKPAGLVVPDNFQSIALIDLSVRFYENEILMQFSLVESSDIEIYFMVENIDTTFIDLRLTGTTIEDRIILRGEDFKSNLGGGHWHETLPPGEYKIVLTSDKSSGIVNLYSE
jgi:hypothetical protein